MKHIIMILAVALVHTSTCVAFERPISEQINLRVAQVAKRQFTLLDPETACFEENRTVRFFTNSCSLYVQVWKKYLQHSWVGIQSEMRSVIDKRILDSREEKHLRRVIAQIQKSLNEVAEAEKSSDSQDAAYAIDTFSIYPVYVASDLDDESGPDKIF